MLFLQIETLNNKKKISCLLSADGAEALFHFLFLANFIDIASAYFFLLLFQFSFQTSE